VYVYLEHSQNSSEIIGCFEPKLVSLERTGTIKVVTISALISHFLPYFNSSINPIIYNIMSGKYFIYLYQISFDIKFLFVLFSC
jgi:hypothetical protein